MRNTLKYYTLLCIGSMIAALLFSACGSNGTTAPAPPAVGGYWADFVNKTLPSGFKLIEITDGEQQNATLISTPADNRAALSFAIDPDYRSNRGWLFRGNDQAVDYKADQMGAAEIVKTSGWLRIGETFDYDRSLGLYTQPAQIRMPFIGYAGDLMFTLLSNPYIGFPTDESKTWTGGLVHVSDGTTSIDERYNYRIHYLGTCDLMEGASPVAGYNDVIHIEGTSDNANSQGRIDAYLAPDAGIIYYHLVTAFGQEGAAALIGFSGGNQSVSGATVKDYFPTAPGNHWVYEFSPDDHVPQFRFSVKKL